jgi:hypothetical protein
MNCRTVRNQFDELYRQGGGDPANAARVHLSSCADCAREFRRWKEIAAALEKEPRVEPPETFAQKVMIAYENQRRHAPGFNLMPLRPPQAAWVLLIIVMLAGVFVLTQRSARQPQPPTAASENVRFELAASGAASVALVGDFNNWDRKGCVMKPDKKGTWSIELQLSAGSYQYLFLIDDMTWQLDTLNVHSTPDGFGGMNSEITL